jgi:hypothetical protein
VLFRSLSEQNIELKGQIGAIKLLNKSNPKQLCNLLYNYLKDYETEINTTNEDFFIQLSYKEQEKAEDNLLPQIIDYLNMTNYYFVKKHKSDLLINGAFNKNNV